MATLTVGLGKTYDTINAAQTASADGDTVEYYYTEYWDVPGEYRETLNITSSKSLTFTCVDRGTVIKGFSGKAIESEPNTGKTHTLTNMEVISYGSHGLLAQPTGTTNINQCSFVGKGNHAIGMQLSGSNGGTINCNQCKAFSTAYYGTRIWTDASGTIVVRNLTSVSLNRGVYIQNNAKAVDGENIFAYSWGGGDYYFAAGASISGTYYSTDGSESSTDIGTIADASFVDWKTGDIHIKTGSGLDNVGVDVGTITDIDGNRVDTSANPFAGCSSIAAASSDPANVYYLNSGDDYVVYCDDPGDELLKLRIVVNIGGTDYYVVDRPYQNRRGYVLTTDSDVLIPYKGTPVAFNTSETVASITAYWINANDVASSGVAASNGADFPDVGNVRDTDTTNGDTGTLDSDNILKSNATGSGAGNYNDDNLTDGNVRPVDYGVSSTGDLSNLDGTESAYTTLEAARNVGPGEVNVKDSETYKIHDVDKEGSYGPTDSVQPNITAVVDDETGSSLTATVSGDASNTEHQLYYREKGDTSWTTGLTRTGDGDIQQTGLTDATWYEFVDVATDAGNSPSVPSGTKSAKVTDGSSIATPSGMISAPLDYLNKTIAGSSTFQDEVGAIGESDAIDRVYSTLARRARARVSTITGGVVSAVTVQDAGCGYYSTPTILIQGDGSGATASATISDGEVTDITVTDGGSGYSGECIVDIGLPDMPFAVTNWLDNFRRGMLSGGARNYFATDADLGVQFRFSVDASHTDKEMFNTFNNKVGAIFSEMEVLAGTAGYLNIISWSLEDGPARPDIEERESEGDYIEAIYRVVFTTVKPEL